MNITGSQNDYIRNLVNTVTKGKHLTMGTVQYGTLYLLINNGLLYNISVPDFANVGCSFGIDEYAFDESCIRDNQFIFFNMHMNEIIKAMSPSVNGFKMIYDNPNIREVEEFEKMANAKSEDGAFRYFVDTSERRVFMYLQKSMFSLTKADKCSLQIYKNSANYYNNSVGEYLAKFNIYKSKLKTNIDLSFKFIS